MINQSTWLPHLNNEIMYEARGFELDAYLIALEGWRRGLTLKWHVKDDEDFSKMKTWFVEHPGKLFSLSNESRTHYFFRTRGDLVPNEAVTTAMDKVQTKAVFESKGIPTPEGFHIDLEMSLSKIFNEAEKLGYPLVVKPQQGSFGRGVHVDITSPDVLNEVLTPLLAEPKRTPLIVEKYIQAKDYRLYVVDGEVVAAIERIKPHVIGDGKQSVLRLIDQKNNLRKENPRLVSCLIEVNQELKDTLNKAELKLSSVPGKDEVVILNEKNNISIGGDSTDVFEQLTEAMKKTAIQALQAVDGLTHGAVDLLIDQNDEPYVLELNPTSQIGSLVFPMHGEARDVPAKIVDYYFPETKNTTHRSDLFFDFYDVLEPLNNRVATQTVVSNPPIGEVHGRQYIVSGDVLNVEYHRGIRKHAFENQLSGFVSVREDETIEVVVVGLNQDLVEHFEECISDDPERSSVSKIESYPYDIPVKVGFEIKADRKIQLQRLQDTKSEIKQLDKDIRYLEKKIKKYYRSFSWRITFPVRIGGAVYKWVKSLVK